MNVNSRPMMFAVIAFTTACHGAGSSSPVLPAQVGQSTKTPGTMSVSVFVPVPSAGVSIPQSLVLSLERVNGALPGTNRPFTVNLASTAQGCHALAGGAISCTIAVPAPPGKDVFTLVTYSAPNGAGKPLATQHVESVVSANAKNCAQKPPAVSSAPGVSR